MEDCDLVATEEILPSRADTEQRPLQEFSPVKRKLIDLEMCRFCLKTWGVMINIFNSNPELSVPIAEMISLITGHHVSKGDSFPENICQPCLEDATKAFKIKQTYQRSHEFFCQLKKDSQKAEDLLEKESQGCNPRETQQVVGIHEKMERAEVDALEREELDQCLVKNEPIVDDSTEADHQISEGEVYLSDSEVKSETTQPEEGSKPSITRPHKCSQCPKSFKRLDHLKVHLISHTDERPHQCGQCPSAFKSLNCLQRHLKTHSVRVQLKCDLCDRTYSREHTLKVHRINCVKSKIIEKEKLSLLEKVRSQRYKCTECPKSYSEEADLSEHLLAHSGKMSYVCSICDKRFVQKSSLQRHLRWHKDERTFKCSQCPKSFPVEEQLTEHILTHQGINPFKCSQCPKSFLLKYSLDRHFLSHTGERPYKCTQCEKSFAFSNHLKLHTMAHAGKSPYQCPHCPKSFFGKTNLADHIVMHTGERPHKCPHCPKDFKRKTYLNEHLRYHTGESLYKCDMCQKTNANRTNHKNHMLTHRDKSK